MGPVLSIEAEDGSEDERTAAAGVEGASAAPHALPSPGLLASSACVLGAVQRERKSETRKGGRERKRTRQKERASVREREHCQMQTDSAHHHPSDAAREKQTLRKQGQSTGCLPVGDPGGGVSGFFFSAARSPPPNWNRGRLDADAPCDALSGGSSFTTTCGDAADKVSSSALRFCPMSMGGGKDNGGPCSGVLCERVFGMSARSNHVEEHGFWSTWQRQGGSRPSMGC